MKNEDVNKFLIFSLFFIPAFFIEDNAFKDIYPSFIYILLFLGCICSLNNRRDGENIYTYYSFKILAVVYISSFIYAVVRYFYLKYYM